MGDKLTGKQERFCQEYLIDLNATQAAERSKYSKHTANEQGSRLLANVSIQARIQELQSKVSKKLELTHEKVLNDLEEARIKSAEDKQYSAAIRASELQGKHIGTFTERIDVNLGNCGAVRDIDGEEEDNNIHFPQKVGIGSEVTGVDEKEEKVE